MDRRTLGAWLGIPLLMAASIWVVASTPLPDADVTAPLTVSEGVVCDAPLTTSRARTIGAFGLELENTEVAEEHVAYHDRRMQWGYQAFHGDMHLAMTWDAVSAQRDVLELFVDDRHGNAFSVTGRSPLRVTVPVPDLRAHDAWVVDLWVAPTPGMDAEPQAQALRLDLASSC